MVSEVKSWNFWLSRYIKPYVVAIQETKIDSTITTSELFPQNCMCIVYRKTRNSHGGEGILLMYRDISHWKISLNQFG